MPPIVQMGRMKFETEAPIVHAICMGAARQSNKWGVANKAWLAVVSSRN